MNIIVPMAGSDQLFKDSGYNFPKNLIEVMDKPLIQHVFESLNKVSNANLTFIIRKEEQERYHTDGVLKLINPDCKVITTEGNTAGAACTVLLAIEDINNEDSLLITNGDQIILEDMQKIVSYFQERNLDGGIVTFESIHPRWSYALLDNDGYVIETAEKRPISKNATAGVYYFKHGRDFVSACIEMIKKGASVDGKYFVCPVYNEMILKQKKICVYKIEREQYRSLAVPQDIVSYEKYLLKQMEGEK